MRIKNNALRKLESKRLWLLGYSIPEITERTGSSTIELDRWRMEEGWDDEKKQLQKSREKHRHDLLNRINTLMSDIDNPAVLSSVIIATSNLPLQDIQEISIQIVKHFKGGGHE